MTPPERSEWTVTEASKRQFGAELWPPGMRVLVDVWTHLSFVLRRNSCYFFLYSAVAIPNCFRNYAGFRLRQGRAQAM
jgi:hypothetical protein